MPEPQNDNEQSDAGRVRARESAAREQSEREHEDVLAALIGDDAYTDDASEPEDADPAPADDPAPAAAPEDASADDEAETDESGGSGDAAEPAAEDAPVAGAAVQYGVGPFSIRELALGGVWLVAFVVSFFSILPADRTITTVWTEGINWVLTIAVPTVAVFLLILRRLSPEGIRRVGSLGIDQFASVAFSVSAVVWIGLVWQSITISISYPASSGYYSWVVWTEAVLMLAGVVLTVFAPLIPVFAEDFKGRPERPAHRLARPVRPVAVRPRPVRPVAAPPVAAAPAAPDPASAEAAAEAAPIPAPQPETRQAPAPQPQVAPETTVMDAAPAAAEAETRAVPTATQAFWALVPEQRAVVDASGATLFTVGPTAWALVIEERDDLFVVRHEDGRVGYLRDVSGVTRG